MVPAVAGVEPQVSVGWAASLVSCFIVGLPGELSFWRGQRGNLEYENDADTLFPCVRFRVMCVVDPQLLAGLAPWGAPTCNCGGTDLVLDRFGFACLWGGFLFCHTLTPWRRDPCQRVCFAVLQPIGLLKSIETPPMLFPPTHACMHTYPIPGCACLSRSGSGSHTHSSHGVRQRKPPAGPLRPPGPLRRAAERVYGRSR